MNAMQITIQDFPVSVVEPTRMPRDGKALSCENLFFRYSKKTDWVINDFSHAFAPGITIIKGSSGCGKSTLLRILAGYLNSSGGKVITPRGVAPSDREFQRRELGFVFQQLN